MLTLITRINDIPEHYLLIKVTILEKVNEMYEIYFTDRVFNGTVNQESSSIASPKQHLVEIMDSISKHSLFGGEFTSVIELIEKDLPYTADLLMLPIYILQFAEEKRGPNKAMQLLDPNSKTNFKKEILAKMRLYIEGGLQAW